MKTITYEYKPSTDTITVANEAVRRGRRGGVAIGMAGTLALVGLGAKTADAYNDIQLKEEFSQTDYFDTLAKDSASGLDPRTAASIRADAAANPNGFKPFSTVLANGTRVTVEQTQTGQTPTSIAAELAPGLDDSTAVTEVITAQATPDGNSNHLQPGKLVIVPADLLKK
ncbi:MAG TPA: hypothetical protein PLT04_00545 [Candidatus Saccharibacteria bacterium]|nr:hypothetical protein [Candidatus Saccharibacteria bacterium]